LTGATASVSPSSNISLFNPFLTAEDIQGTMKLVLLVMMTVNRVNQVTLSIQQAKATDKILRGMLDKIGTPSAFESLRKELCTLSATLAATLSAKRHFSKKLSERVYEIDPRFLLFEFCHGLILREAQVKLVHKLLDEIQGGKSVCHQMLMGAGKTTVVGPLLAMLLASSSSMIIEVVPAALLDFSAGVLRERFCSAIVKPVFTFTFDRYEKVSEHLLCKLQTARFLRAVVVSTPSSVKSFMLKFLELSHILNRQKNLTEEKKEIKSAQKRTIASMLGIRRKPGLSWGELTKEEIDNLRRQLEYCDKILELLKGSIEIMDEVDLILHPLKSELNWPLGLKEPLDFTSSRIGNGLRWHLPSHLLDAIFCCCGMPVLADIADSKAAGSILDQLRAILDEGFSTLQIQKSPHLVILSKSFYE